MSRPKLEDPRTVTISFKVSRKEFNKIKGSARIYTREGISDYIRTILFSGQKVGRKPNEEKETTHEKTT